MERGACLRYYNQTKLKKLNKLGFKLVKKQVDALNTGEITWKGNGTIESEEYITYYSGDEKSGVGILLIQ